MPGDYLATKILDRGAGGNGQVAVLRGGWRRADVGNPLPNAVPVDGISVQRSGSISKLWADSSGARKVFTLAKDAGASASVYDLDFGTGNWAQIAGTAVNDDPQWWNGWLGVYGSDANPYLVGVFRSTTLRIALLTYDGSTWTLTDTGTLVGGNVTTGGAFVYKGIVHWFARNNFSQAYTFDPVTKAFSVINMDASLGATDSRNEPLSFTLGKRFFVLQSGSGAGILFEFITGSWIALENSASEPLLARFEGFAAATMGCVLRITDTKVLMVFPGRAAGGGNADGLQALTCELVGGVPTLADVTDPVIPPFLRSGTSVGNPIYYNCFGLSDGENTRGAPQHLIYFNPDGSTDGTAWSLLQATDDATQLAVLESPEIDNAWAPPFKAFPGAGGDAYYPGALQVFVTFTQPDPLGLRIRFRCNGDPGNADKTVRLRYVDSFGVPVTIGSLVAGSATGGSATVVGNEIQNVDADPSITYEVVWDFLSEAPAISNASRLHYDAEIERP